MINFCLFEDDGYQQLMPLTEFRPVYSCLIGMNTIFDRFLAAFNFGNITLHCRSYLKAVMKEHYKEFNINNINSGAPCLFYNGRVMLSSSVLRKLEEIGEQQNTLFTSNGIVVAAYLKGNLLNVMIQLLVDTPTNKDIIKQVRSKCVAVELDDCDILQRPWDFIELNSKYLSLDFELKKQPGVIKGRLSPFTVIQNEDNVFIEKNVVLEDFVVVNADNGPVCIDENVVVQAHTRLEGPLYIGKNTVVLGGNICSSSIGNDCKVHGEISHSIFSAYSNKAHEGFVGHSYIGSWVNLGAQTITSNLKNNYSLVSVQSEGKKVSTDCQFLGSIIGDYVKTSIGTCFNTGTIVHSGADVFNHEFSVKYYAPFVWGCNGTSVYYDLQKFIITVERMMLRRQQQLTPNLIDLIAFLHKRYTRS